jgi:hypothetical protein
MRTDGKTFQRACDVLRSRVRFEPPASLRLPGRERLSQDDTALIREATRVYVEAWIVPLINSMQSGDASDIKIWLP